MSQYVCSICGYIYDEKAGCPESNIPPGTVWADVPPDFSCPLCGAPKEEFNKKTESPPGPEAESVSNNSVELPDEITYSFTELSAIFSNLAKGCEKQYDFEMSELYMQLSSYYAMKRNIENEAGFESMENLLREDLASRFVMANQVAGKNGDRGALRALKWAEQVSRMNSAHLSRMKNGSADFIENTNVYVCEICGFIFVGDEKPEVCPVCKVPSMKMTQIRKGA